MAIQNVSSDPSDMRFSAIGLVPRTGGFGEDLGDKACRSRSNFIPGIRRNGRKHPFAHGQRAYTMERGPEVKIIDWNLNIVLYRMRYSPPKAGSGETCTGDHLTTGMELVALWYLF